MCPRQDDDDDSYLQPLAKDRWAQEQTGIEPVAMLSQIHGREYSQWEAPQG